MLTSIKYIRNGDKDTDEEVVSYSFIIYNERTFHMAKDTVSFSDFQKLDMRIGKVITAEDIIASTSLIRLKVNLGPDYKTHIILAGVKKWYKPKDLKGKKFIFIANLEPKKMMGEESCGMMLACCDNVNKPTLLPVNPKIKEGTVVR